MIKGGIVKKLFLTLLVSLGFMSSVNATDFIAVATQGKFNENSLGVKALSDEEMSKVVGGIVRFYTNPYPSIGRYTNYYYFEKEDFKNVSQSEMALMNKEMSFYLRYDEIPVYAKRFHRGQVEWTWLAGYNVYTGQFRDLGLSASMKTFQFIDSQYKYSHY